MIIIHLTSSLSGGGAEHFLLNLCKESKKHKGLKMLVISITDIDTIAFKFQREDIDIHFLHMRKTAGSLYTGIGTLYNILSPFRKSSVIIHAHMFHACILACIIRLFQPQFSVIFTLHNTFIKQKHRRWLIWMCKSFRNRDIIFPGSKRMFFQKNDSVSIPYGIEISNYYRNKLKPNVFTCLFAGRLEQQKNPIYLIQLVNKLKHLYQFKIVVVGTGLLRKNLQDLIIKNGLEDYFDIRGFHPSMPELLANMHCLLLPSLWEGMPMILLEAGASKLPIVTTPVGNIAGFLDMTQAYVTNIKQFHLELERLMNDYAHAEKKADIFYNSVCRSYTIEKSLVNHVELAYKPILKKVI